MQILLMGVRKIRRSQMNYKTKLTKFGTTYAMHEFSSTIQATLAAQLFEIETTHGGFLLIPKQLI